jgi:hypothetical protein
MATSYFAMVPNSWKEIQFIQYSRRLSITQYIDFEQTFHYVKIIPAIVQMEKGDKLWSESWFG